MVQTVASVDLPIHEQLLIQKNRIVPENPAEENKRICIVTGTHGDELEGQYVCYQLNQILQKNIQHLHGIVDIYPALNPMGINTISRGIPQFDLDMNRIFPGTENGPCAEYIARKIVDDIAGADLCVDIHASNIYLREIPQIRINENVADALIPYAKLLNVDFIWVHAAATVLESTLAHSLNSIGVKTLVVEMGVGMRITKYYGDQLVDGLLCAMKKLGVWDGETSTPKEPIVSRDGKVGFVNANTSGIFLPRLRHGDVMRKGDLIGTIVNPLNGAVEEELLSPCDGLLFTLREYPVVYGGSLIARVLEEVAQ